MTMRNALSHEDKATYLANVLSVAKADGTDSREEALALQAIAERIDAEQSHFLGAQRLLAAGNYQLTPVQSRRHRMSNVQDMVMMAMADGEVSKQESGPIEAFSAQLELSQVDMDILVKRAQLDRDRVLARAGESAREATHRTAESGPPPPVPAPPPPPPPVTVKAPQAAPPIPEVHEVEQVADEVGEADAAAPTPEATVDKPVDACMRARDGSEDPVSYCYGAGSDSVNVWGCRLARMAWDVDANWFELGEWRDDDTYLFDKEAIRARLAKNLTPVWVCPHVSERYIEAVLEAFPKVASIWGRWQHQLADVDEPGARPVTISEYVHGVAITVTRVVRGVEPVGRREAIKLILRATKRSGRPTPDTDLLA